MRTVARDLFEAVLAVIVLLAATVMLNGCATYTKEMKEEDEAESRRRVEAMTKAGTYQGPTERAPERDYAAEGLVNGLGYLADKWGQPKVSNIPQRAPQGQTCKTISVTNPTNGMYDLVQKCE